MSSLALTRFLPLTDTTSIRTRMTARSCDISGQCSKCLDFFTITVLLVHGKPSIANTARMEWQQGEPYDEDIPVLIHRPGLCNGKIKLYGSLEKLSLPPTERYVVPRSNPKAAHQPKLASKGH